MQCLGIFADLQLLSILVRNDFEIIVVQFDYDSFPMRQKTLLGFSQSVLYHSFVSKFTAVDAGYFGGQLMDLFDSYPKPKPISTFLSAYVMSMNPFDSCVEMTANYIEQDFTFTSAPILQYQEFYMTFCPLTLSIGSDECQLYQLIDSSDQSIQMVQTTLKIRQLYSDTTDFEWCTFNDQISLLDYPTPVDYVIGEDVESIQPLGKIFRNGCSFCGLEYTFETIKVYQYVINTPDLLDITSFQEIFQVDQSQQNLIIKTQDTSQRGEYEVHAISRQQNGQQAIEKFQVNLMVNCDNDFGMIFFPPSEITYFVGPTSLIKTYEFSLIKDNINGICGVLQNTFLSDPRFSIDYQITSTKLILNFQAIDDSLYGGEGIKRLTSYLRGQFEFSSQGYQKSLPIVINLQNCLDFDIPQFSIPSVNYKIGTERQIISDLSGWTSSNSNCPLTYSLPTGTDTSFSILTNSLTVYQGSGFNSRTQTVTVKANYIGFPNKIQQSSFTIRIHTQSCSSSELTQTNNNFNTFTYTVGNVPNTITFNAFTTSSLTCTIWDYQLKLQNDSSIPSFMTFIGSSRVLTMNPTSANVGTYQLKLRGQLINNQQPTDYQFSIQIKKCEASDVYLTIDPPPTKFEYFSYSQNEIKGLQFQQYLAPSTSGCDTIKNTFTLADGSLLKNKGFIYSHQDQGQTYLFVIQTSAYIFDGIYTITVTGKSGNYLQIVKSYTLELNITSCKTAWIGAQQFTTIYSQLIFGSQTWLQFPKDNRCDVTYTIFNVTSNSAPYSNIAYLDNVQTHIAQLRIVPPNNVNLIGLRWKLRIKAQMQVYSGNFASFEVDVVYHNCQTTSFTAPTIQSSYSYVPGTITEMISIGSWTYIHSDPLCQSIDVIAYLDNFYPLPDFITFFSSPTSLILNPINAEQGQYLIKIVAYFGNGQKSELQTTITVQRGCQQYDILLQSAINPVKHFIQNPLIPQTYTFPIFYSNNTACGSVSNILYYQNQQLSSFYKPLFVAQTTQDSVSKTQTITILPQNSNSLGNQTLNLQGKILSLNLMKSIDIVIEITSCQIQTIGTTSYQSTTYVLGSEFQNIAQLLIPNLDSHCSYEMKLLNAQIQRSLLSTQFKIQNNNIQANLTIDDGFMIGSTFQIIVSYYMIDFPTNFVNEPINILIQGCSPNSIVLSANLGQFTYRIGQTNIDNRVIYNQWTTDDPVCQNWNTKILIDLNGQLTDAPVFLQHFKSNQTLIINDITQQQIGTYKIVIKGILNQMLYGYQNFTLYIELLDCATAIVSIPNYHNIQYWIGSGLQTFNLQQFTVSIQPQIFRNCSIFYSDEIENQHYPYYVGDLSKLFTVKLEYSYSDCASAITYSVIKQSNMVIESSIQQVLEGGDIGISIQNTYQLLQGQSINYNLKAEIIENGKTYTATFSFYVDYLSGCDSVTVFADDDLNQPAIKYNVKDDQKIIDLSGHWSIPAFCISAATYSLEYKIDDTPSYSSQIPNQFIFDSQTQQLTIYSVDYSSKGTYTFRLVVAISGSSIITRNTLIIEITDFNPDCAWDQITNKTEIPISKNYFISDPPMLIDYNILNGKINLYCGVIYTLISSNMSEGFQDVQTSKQLIIQTANINLVGAYEIVFKGAFQDNLPVWMTFNIIINIIHPYQYSIQDKVSNDFPHYGLSLLNNYLGVNPLNPQQFIGQSFSFYLIGEVLQYPANKAQQEIKISFVEDCSQATLSPGMIENQVFKVGQENISLNIPFTTDPTSCALITNFEIRQDINEETNFVSVTSDRQITIGGASILDINEYFIQVFMTITDSNFIDFISFTLSIIDPCAVAKQFPADQNNLEVLIGGETIADIIPFTTDVTNSQCQSFSYQLDFADSTDPSNYLLQFEVNPQQLKFFVQDYQAQDLKFQLILRGFLPGLDPVETTFFVTVKVNCANQQMTLASSVVEKIIYTVKDSTIDVDCSSKFKLNFNGCGDVQYMCTYSNDNPCDNEVDGSQLQSWISFYNQSTQIYLLVSKEATLNILSLLVKVNIGQIEATSQFTIILVCPNQVSISPVFQISSYTYNLKSPNIIIPLDSFKQYPIVCKRELTITVEIYKIIDLQQISNDISNQSSLVYLDNGQQLIIHSEDQQYVGKQLGLKVVATQAVQQGQFAFNIFTLNVEACQLLNLQFPQSESKDFYLIGSGQKITKIPEVVQTPNCNYAITYQVQYPDISPQGIQINSNTLQITINSNSPSDAGTFEYKVKAIYSKTLQAQYSYKLEQAAKILAPPYFNTNLENFILNSNTIVQYQLPQVIKPTGNNYIIKKQFGEASRFVQFYQKTMTFVFAPTQKQMGKIYLIQIELIDKLATTLMSTYEIHIYVRDPANSSQVQSLLRKINTKLYEPALKPEITSIDQLGEVTIKFNMDLLIPNSYQNFNENVIRIRIKSDSQFNMQSKQQSNRNLAQLEDVKNQGEEVFNYTWKITKFTNNEIKLLIDFKEPLKVSQQGSDYLSIQFIMNGFFISEKTKKPIQFNYYMQKKMPRQMRRDCNKLIDDINNIVLSGIIADMAGTTKQAIQTVMLGNFALQLVLQNLMQFIVIIRATTLQYLWGMINALQIIFHLPLLRLSFPSNTQFVFATFISLTQFDVVPSQAIEQDIFQFQESEPINDEFFIMDIFK
ncbi:ig family protein [Stylonychia lemnae]|uniref:Ig family protein n=1 Tax=Stylonychia lemnae TaxID=5949 RepID=A0A077ZN11_STYLE|nr:ig family protein [Stylonychia lemnae]|eukprot:CDW71357.1 ig family protein [Stylonychia lemnae]